MLPRNRPINFANSFVTMIREDNKHMIAGLVAGSASTIALYPLDLIKVRMQVFDGAGSRYASLMGGFRSILKEEGYKALYKGMSPALLASALSWGGYFYFYELSKKRRLASKARSPPPSSSSIAVAGTVAASPLLPSIAADVRSSIPSAAGGGSIAEEGEVAINPSVIDASTSASTITTTATASSSSSSSSPTTVEKLDTYDHLLAGVEAGAIMVLVTNPLWLMKTRLQLQVDRGLAARHNYRGFIDAFRTILREEGALGFYRGFLPAMLLTSHGAVQFAVYEQAKSSYQLFSGNSNPNQQPPWLSMILGGFSKIAATCATYPYQVLKSRLQQRGEETEVAATSHASKTNNITSTTSNSGSSSSSSAVTEVKFRPKYSGVMDCLVKTIRNEGIYGFFRGLVPNCLRVAPASAITFLVYEELLKIL